MTASYPHERPHEKGRTFPLFNPERDLALFHVAAQTRIQNGAMSFSQLAHKVSKQLIIRVKPARGKTNMDFTHVPLLRISSFASALLEEIIERNERAEKVPY